MKFQVNKGVVKHKGVFHTKGSFFDAEKSEVAPLIKSGFVSEAIDPEDADDTGEVEAPTPDEFAELKADDQRDILHELEIEPGSNAEHRLKQYTEWYEQDDDLEGEGQGGEQQ